MTPLHQSTLPFPLLRRGKVREVYDIDPDTVLLVATDRVSAFDVVMREAVPFKGAVLTQLTAWWLGQLAGIGHHMITADADEIIDRVPALARHRHEIAGRAMLSLRANVFPVECVARGYLSGSGWKDYKRTGMLAGEVLPPGLQESERLPAPRFTPATKAESGHDENITPAQAAALLGPVGAQLERLTLDIYGHGASLALRQGIIVADTKLEFGERDGRVILVDEVLTPDSSRFWAADQYRPGTTPPSFDKQPLRDYLESERAAGRWNGDAPPPPLPAEVVEATSRRYLDAFHRLTGTPLHTMLLT